MSWKIKRRMREQLEREQGYFSFPAGTRQNFALVYPNSYFVGMSNLGLHIIYDLLNRRGDTACERFFLPSEDEQREYEHTGTPLLSLENQLPLYRFPLIGFAVSFEMDYFNLLRILQLGKVKLLAEERGEHDAIVLAGGPCSTFNPEPLSLFVDAFIIGEGEAVMPPLMDAYASAMQAGLPRADVLRALAEVEGVYVPSLYEHSYDAEGRLCAIRPKKDAPSRVARQWVRNLDDFPAHTVVVTDDTEFDLYLIETARGCGRHCRFCMAGYCFRQPRNRSLSVLEKEVREARRYGKRIGLMGAAISDYPEIDALCRDILKEDLGMSVASFRADSVSEELVDSLAKSGLRTITLAPEAGSMRMRKVINKGIEEEHLLHTVDLALQAGIRQFKLYIMIGLPYEEEEDVEAISAMVLRLEAHIREKKERAQITLSINPFIPKPCTPFQWLPMAEEKWVKASMKTIRKSLAPYRNIRIIAESPKSAYVQGVLARGDRRVSRALHRAFLAGGAKSFKRALQEEGLAFQDFLQATHPEEAIFPWDVLDMGFSKQYLYRELQRAAALQYTKPCFSGCTRCGVCDTMEERHVSAQT